jgi:hypothetical protein
MSTPGTHGIESIMIAFAVVGIAVLGVILLPTGGWPWWIAVMATIAAVAVVGGIGWFAIWGIRIADRESQHY